jgi:methylthioribose-1-phosphate isomerase
VPFYVALPGPTIDWQMTDGVNGIPIEQRESEEVTHIRGKNTAGAVDSVQITPDGVTACNYAFYFTPARLVTGLFTERGVCAASEEGLLGLYPEQKDQVQKEHGR